MVTKGRVKSDSNKATLVADDDKNNHEANIEPKFAFEMT